jgi:perosamine synthetase
LIDKRLHIMNSLKDLGIETREGFIPYNLQNIFIDRGWTNPNECPNANKIAYSSFYLPTGPDISENELDYVATNFCKIIYSLI